MTSFNLVQYKLLYIILNNTEVYKEPVPRTKKIPCFAVKFEAGEENSIIHECLDCCTVILDVHSCTAKVKVVSVCPFGLSDERLSVMQSMMHGGKCGHKTGIIFVVAVLLMAVLLRGAKRILVQSGLESHRLTIVFLWSFLVRLKLRGALFSF